MTIRPRSVWPDGPATLRLHGLHNNNNDNDNNDNDNSNNNYHSCLILLYFRAHDAITSNTTGRDPCGTYAYIILLCRAGGAIFNLLAAATAGETAH